MLLAVLRKPQLQASLRLRGFGRHIHSQGSGKDHLIDLWMHARKACPGPRCFFVLNLTVNSGAATVPSFSSLTFKSSFGRVGMIACFCSCLIFMICTICVVRQLDLHGLQGIPATHQVWHEAPFPQHAHVLEELIGFTDTTMKNQKYTFFAQAITPTPKP